jgi:hypothetical protein
MVREGTRFMLHLSHANLVFMYCFRLLASFGGFSAYSKVNPFAAVVNNSGKSPFGIPSTGGGIFGSGFGFSSSVIPRSNTMPSPRKSPYTPLYTAIYLIDFNFFFDEDKYFEKIPPFEHWTLLYGFVST